MPNYVLFSSCLILLDWISKYYAMKLIAPSKVIHTVLPFVSFANVNNYGIGFGLAQGYVHHIIILNIVMLFFIGRLYKDAQGLNKLALVCLFSGGISNLADRFIYGYVRDFILISYQNYSFPVFNFADCYLTIGVILLFVVFFEKKDVHEN